jgi:hypothetical protein
MRAANKCGVQGPRQRNIGAELRTPVEKALILETGQTGTDAELAHLAAPATARTVLPMIIFRAISLQDVVMTRLVPKGAKLTRIVILSVVIVRVCGRSSKHRTLNLARLCLNLARWDYWMPRLKQGMTTARLTGFA